MAYRVTEVHDGLGASRPAFYRIEHRRPTGGARTRPISRARVPFGVRGLTLTARPFVHARGHVEMIPRGTAPMLSPSPLPLTYAEADALGFSLKPPKWLRKAATSVGRAAAKVTMLPVSIVKHNLPLIEKIAPYAAGALLAPYALPVIASAGGFVAREAGSLVRGAASLLRRPGAAPAASSGLGPSLAQIAQSTAPLLAPRAPAPPAPLQPSDTVPVPPLAMPDSASSPFGPPPPPGTVYGPDFGPPPPPGTVLGPETEAQAAADAAAAAGGHAMPAWAIPLGIAVVGLTLMGGTRRRRREA